MHKVERVRYRLLERAAEGEAGGDRCRQRAAGAVRRCCLDALVSEAAR
jgi:hypothetical protein